MTANPLSVAALLLLTTSNKPVDLMRRPNLADRPAACPAIACVPPVECSLAPYKQLVQTGESAKSAKRGGGFSRSTVIFHRILGTSASVSESRGVARSRRSPLQYVCFSSLVDADGSAVNSL